MSAYRFSTWRGSYSAQDLLPLKRGVVAKVGIGPCEEGFESEWMWVHVVDCFDDGTFGGVLLNRPYFCRTVDAGQWVDGFEASYVHEIRIDPDVWAISRSHLPARTEA